METTQTLTPADIERAIDDDRWEGWGYLGERAHDANSDYEISLADGFLLSRANLAGWDYEQFFAFVNSRAGRHFADWMFDGRYPGEPAPEWILNLFTVDPMTYAV